MPHGHIAVAPDPQEWEDIRTPKARDSSLRLQDGHSAPATLYVNITFNEEAQTRGSTSIGSTVNPSVQKAIHDELCVHTRFCRFSSTFAHRSSGGALGHAMEEKFAASKYKHFRGAFMQVSFAMPLGALGLAAYAAPDGLWVRVAILTCVVAPLYLVYGLFILKREHKYLQFSGTMTEKLLMGMLCLHSLSIVCAEWARPQLDYGMMVMHIGFVQNFTPLSEAAMQTVTAGFGLAPYVLLKLKRFLDDKVTSTAPQSRPASTHKGLCITTKGDTSLLLEILMPLVILMYQVISTMRRDKTMRLDFLNNEQLTAQRKQLKVEKQKCEDLLTSMLPRRIIAALKSNLPIEPQLFNEVTVIFVEICDFSRVCAQLKPKVVVEVLNIIFCELDRLTDLLHVYKVETVGQVYMAVVGCPEPIINHADVSAHFALAAQRSMEHLREQIAGIQSCSHLDDDMDSSPPTGAACTPPATTTKVYPSARGPADGPVINIRVGLNSGKIRAGVVGLDSPRYKLVGDTVNTASRMESTCDPGRVQLSSSTKDRLTRDMFTLEDRGEIAIKGKGMMRTAFLTGYARGGDQEQFRVMIERGPCGQYHGDAEDLTESVMPTMATLASQDDLLQQDGKWFHRDVQRRDNWWKAAINRVDILELGLGDGADRDSWTKGRTSLRNRINTLFLLVPPSQKNPAWMQTLKLDRPKFLEDTLTARISSARTLTIIWLLILSSVSILDYFMDVLNDDLPRYRSAILFRAVGNNVVGLVYLLLLTSKALFRKYAQRLTIGMLAFEGVGLLACGMIIYNSEPAIIAMYGAYVLFYNVCTISQRLIVCALAVVGYVVIELVSCDLEGVFDAGKNIGFLLIFFSFMACGVRLEEHLGHVAHFEQRRVTRRLEEIKQAKAAGSQLLNNLLPPHVVDLVGEGVSPIAEHHPNVTILFTDIKGFTAYAARISPQQLVDLLNAMYSAFDEIILNWALHKVEIIGDAYFISAGCPAPEHPEDSALPHEFAMRAVEVGLAMLRTLPRVCDDASMQMRVGVHTGPVLAGVVGKKGPRYHLFGAAVGYAEKMESHGIPNRVQISTATHALLLEGGHDYDFEPREIEIDDGLPHRTWLISKSNAKAAFQIQKRLMAQRRQSVNSHGPHPHNH